MEKKIAVLWGMDQVEKINEYIMVIHAYLNIHDTKPQDIKILICYDSDSSVILCNADIKGLGKINFNWPITKNDTGAGFFISYEAMLAKLNANLVDALERIYTDYYIISDIHPTYVMQTENHRKYMTVILNKMKKGDE